MKKILTVLIALTITLFAGTRYDMYKSELEKLSTDQRKTMLLAYTYGNEHNLGYTLAAIAWKESNFGMYKTNLYDGKHGSFGVFHCLLESAKARNGVKGEWETSRLAERLMYDFEFSAKEAIAELDGWKAYWKPRRGNQFRNMVASYNAGYKSTNSSAGKRYSEDIALRIQVLVDYFKKTDPFNVNAKKSQYTKNDSSIITNTKYPNQYCMLGAFPLATLRGYMVGTTTTKQGKIRVKNTNYYVALL